MQAERVGSLFWLAVGLISLYGSFHLGLGTMREPGSGFPPFLAGCLIGLAILGFILVLERLGFILTSFLLMFLLFKWVEKLSWAKAVIIPGLTLGLTYLLFDVFLKATLPKGVFGF